MDYIIIFREEKQSNLYISSMIENMASWKIESIPTFCITLERRKDRWKRFQDQPGIQPLGVKRFIGVDGKTLDIKKDKRIACGMKSGALIKDRKNTHGELQKAYGVESMMFLGIKTN